MCLRVTTTRFDRRSSATSHSSTCESVLQRRALRRDRRALGTLAPTLEAKRQHAPKQTNRQMAEGEQAAVGPSLGWARGLLKGRKSLVLQERAQTQQFSDRRRRPLRLAQVA